MNVKELREKKGITQAELSKKSGIPRDRIAKWEQGKGSPKAADEKVLMGIFREQVHNAPVNHTEAQHGANSKDGTNKDVTEIKAKIDVLFDVAVELLSATSGESATLIRKKLEKRVDELRRFSGE